MPAKPLPHDVSPIIQGLRNFLLGRQHNSPLRFADRVSARTQPPPGDVKGCNDKMAQNSYCLRDGRRLVNPPEIISINKASGSNIFLPLSSAEKSKQVSGNPTAKTPGQLYMPK